MIYDYYFPPLRTARYFPYQRVVSVCLRLDFALSSGRGSVVHPSEASSPFNRLTIVHLPPPLLGGDVLFFPQTSKLPAKPPETRLQRGRRFGVASYYNLPPGADIYNHHIRYLPPII
ncbi:uncharacterized protein LDX57_003177 [Aspergillus melleus]|uniref:uncharacterized protein n=1 Tax=Aspergillus melleus TaxID=138277 RepID=UPI001E8DDFEB|nr:uncharacterized protein LDX57_003177 [Aspergillus melleus]KAH8425424.1 hypothetical protein LDX57_003177 [Aspergillus melleus]